MAYLPATASPGLVHTHTYDRSQDSVFLSQDPIPIRKGMQLRSPTTHHAVQVIVHGRRALPRTDDKLAWAEPSPGRHCPEAKYALAAKFLDAELR
jgi:hypothetical protein